MPNSPNRVSTSLIDKTKVLETSLVAKYGPLMSTRNFAELLDIKEISVSNGFANNLPWTRPFRGARIKVGRRVYFNTAEVAEVLRQVQGKDSLRSTTPVHQVYRSIGTRIREENSRFNSLRQVRNIFKINRNVARDSSPIANRKRSSDCWCRSSGLGLGAFHEKAKAM
jgi:hypothetical protein